MSIDQTKKKTAVVVSGYWSTNIGNAFFQLAAEYLLDKVYPNCNVISLSDQPGYWKAGSKGNPDNALVLLEHISFDYLVIQGPFLRPEFDKIWLKTLRTLHGRGVKIIVLAAGMMDYSQENVDRCRAWLAETPPYIFTTRDTQTYENFHDLAEHSYDGIDIAFFLSDYFSPPKMDMGPLVALNFDKWPEPRIWLGKETGQDADYVFEHNGEIFNLKFPKLRTALAQKSRALQFLLSWLPEQFNERIGDLQIVRTDHRFNPVFLRNVFRGPNSFVSDIPQSYLTLYANAELTLSNRVHACVATLAHGNRAMLFSKTPRARLLERVGAADIGRSPQSLDLDRLAEEKAKLTDFLCSVSI